MGKGGTTTTLGVYVERRGTHTAVAPVSVSQQCWASRASEARLYADRTEYLTPHVMTEDVPALQAKLQSHRTRLKKAGKAVELTTPIPTAKLLQLRVGDVVYLTGTICTSRDGAHHRMVEQLKAGRRAKIPSQILDHSTIYHCGPVIFQRGDNWDVVSAGPTTSSRFTTDAAVLAEAGIIKVAIGKGTMGPAMIRALKNRGVYLTAVGGCAVSYRKLIQRVAVDWLDLGYPEAVWIFEVDRFGPLVVGIDSTGQSASQQVMTDVFENVRQIYREEGLEPEKRYVQYPQTFAGMSLEEVIAKCSEK
jgi:fumarate hydratase subunit beta